MMTYRVLIADDAKINRVLIKKTLSRTMDNLIFEEASNGEEVLDILSKKSIDLIILDLIMPVLDGYQVLKILNNSPVYHDIPVIVNSALADISAIEKTLQEGAVDYFKKPLSPNDMKVVLPLKARNALHIYDQSRTISELNAQIDKELQNAHTFAEIMLPRPQRLSKVDLYYKFHPSLYIGGDCFDCAEIDGKTHFIIADVTGHGVAAGMASSMVKMLYRKIIEKPGITPDQILDEMNHSVFDIFDTNFNSKYFMFTAFVGMIEDGVLKYANAGQPYPLIYRAKEKKFESIEENGFVIGMLDDVSYETKEMAIAPGDGVFLYTDGLFCSGDIGDFTDWVLVGKLADQFECDLACDPDEFLDEIYYAFEVRHKAHDSDFTDDVALMLLLVK